MPDCKIENYLLKNDDIGINFYNAEIRKVFFNPHNAIQFDESESSNDISPVVLFSTTKLFLIKKI